MVTLLNTCALNYLNGDDWSLAGVLAMLHLHSILLIAMFDHPFFSNSCLTFPLLYLPNVEDY
jgi:hypothetical protein